MERRLFLSSLRSCETEGNMKGTSPRKLVKEPTSITQQTSDRKLTNLAADLKQKQLQVTTNFHHGCKDFQIDDRRTLSFTNQHGDKVYVVSEKNGIERLLVKALSGFTANGGAQ
jgi:hypothetical protein